MSAWYTFYMCALYVSCVFIFICYVIHVPVLHDFSLSLKIKL